MMIQRIGYAGICAKHSLVLILACWLIGCSSKAPSTLYPDQQAAAEGQQLLFEEKTGEAVAAYTKAIELNVTQPDYYLVRGIAYALQHQNDAALADFNKAIELNSKLAPAFFHRGKLHESLGNAQQAKTDLDKAEQLATSK